MRCTTARSALEALRNALYKFSIYLLTYLFTWDLKLVYRLTMASISIWMTNHPQGVWWWSHDPFLGSITHTTYVDVASCYRLSSMACRSLCLSVCQSVTLVSPAKTAGAIKMPFGMRTRLGPRRLGWLKEALAQVQLYLPGGANVPSYEGTLAPPGKCDWAARLWRQCGFMSNYFDHSLNFEASFCLWNRRSYALQMWYTD